MTFPAFKLVSKKRSSAPPSPEPLLQMWQDAADDYAAAVKLFSSTDDPKLIEAAIFDMKAAEARRSFALLRLREEQAQKTAAPLRIDRRQCAE